MATSHNFVKLTVVLAFLSISALAGPNHGQQLHMPRKHGQPLYGPENHGHQTHRPSTARGGMYNPSNSPPACKTTPYPQLCTHILQSSSSPAAPLNRQVSAVSSFALTLTASSYRLASHLASLPPPRSAPKTYSGALQDCLDLMSNTMDQLRLSISRLSDANTARTSGYALRAKVMDAQVSLSASFTFQDTCSDELHQHSSASISVTAQLMKQVADTTRAVTVALSLADALQRRVSP